MDATLEKNCDALFDDVYSQIQAVQSDYFAAPVDAGLDMDGKPLQEPRDRFWQGLVTPSSIPTKTVPKSPDPTVAPAYQEESWVDVGVTLPDSCVCALRCDVYEGPAGKFWSLTGLVRESGQLYQRVQVSDSGEAWRDTGGAWIAVEG